jgi:hypothetical protein
MGRRIGRVVAERYHARLLRSPREVHSALRYVLLNARKHAVNASNAMRTTKVLLDPASSARWFDGWIREVSAEARGAPAGLSIAPVVARARTWLLRKGWRIHGLLHPVDVPGAARVPRIRRWR